MIGIIDEEVSLEKKKKNCLSFRTIIQLVIHEQFNFLTIRIHRCIEKERTSLLISFLAVFFSSSSQKQIDYDRD